MATLDHSTLARGIREEGTAERSRRSRWPALAPLADFSVLTLAVAAERIGHASANPKPAPTVLLLVFPPLTLAVLASARFYRPRLRLQLLDDLRTISGATAIAAMTTVSLLVLLHGQPSVASEGVRLWLFSTVYLVASRAGVISAVTAARRSGAGAPTLIVGGGAVARTIADRLAAHPELGLCPIGFLDKEPLDADVPGGFPVLGASWDLERVIAQHRAEHVVIAFSTAPHDVMLRLIDRCTACGVRVSVVPRLYEKLPHEVSVDFLGGIPLLSMYPSSPVSWPIRMKYAADRLLAAFLVLVFAPVLLAITLAVWATLGRPIFFRQVRVGRDGKRFAILKFRSMRGNEPPPVDHDPADRLRHAPGGVEGDDRRTRLGTFLRRSSLDELPQLFNVLRGDMSLVGPRPERPEFVDFYSENVRGYPDRHRMKSGITGWSQINGLRGKTSIFDRVEWDNWYIENWSPWLDVKILFGTLRAVALNLSFIE